MEGKRLSVSIEKKSSKSLFHIISDNKREKEGARWKGSNFSPFNLGQLLFICAHYFYYIILLYRMEKKTSERNEILFVGVSDQKNFGEPS